MLKVFLTPLLRAAKKGLKSVAVAVLVEVALGTVKLVIARRKLKDEDMDLPR